MMTVMADITRPAAGVEGDRSGALLGLGAVGSEIETKHLARQTLAHITALPLTSFVARGKTLTLTEPQSPPLCNGDACLFQWFCKDQTP